MLDSLKKLTQGAGSVRLGCALMLVLLTVIDLASHRLSGGWGYSYIDELLAVPMMYFTVRILFPQEMKYLPTLVFAVRAVLRMVQYLAENGIPAVNGRNFSATVRGTFPYVKPVLISFAGLVLLCCGLLFFRIFRQAYDHQSRQRRRLMMAELLCVVLVLSAGAGYLVWEDNAITVTHYVYTSGKVSASLSGYKIMQISDLHNKSFGEHSHFLMKKIEAEQPDIILLTGDLVDANRTDIDIALDFVRRAAAVAPVYYITGNHEEALPWEQYARLKRGLLDAGVTVLDSEYVVISRSRGVIFHNDRSANYNDAAVLADAPDDVFNLIGLANQNLFGSRINYIVPHSQSLNILLAHQPQGIDVYTTEPVDLIFSGHAHGGQIRLPLFGPVYAPGQGFRPRYTEGTYEYGNATMVVSRGLGNSVFPLRVNNRPEVVVVELKAI